MLRVLLSLLMIVPVGAFAAGQGDKFVSCGPGYVLTTHARIDGITAYECQKLWCRDLETGKPMGSGDKANKGYRATDSANKLYAKGGQYVECFGDRKWCSGNGGDWNAEYGAYTRGGGDGLAYTSYLQGDCWKWRLGKPNCPVGEIAIERNNEWICVTSISLDGGNAKGSHSSSIRRTGTLRRL